MEKKNTSLIITIIILVICVIGLSGYIVYDKVYLKKQNDTSNIENQNDNTINTNNINPDKKDIVTKEINMLIGYLNGEMKNDISSGMNSTNMCMMHLETNLEEINFYSGKDIFENAMIDMYSCIHNVNLTQVEDNPFNGSFILSKEQYEDYLKYFYKSLDLYDNKWINYPLTQEDDEDYQYENHFYENAKQYLNKKYYYGTGIGDGFGADDIKYSLDSINKISNDTYEIIINANTKTNYEIDASGLAYMKPGNIEQKYQGKLKVEVVGEYLKYNPLIFNKVS